jgi:hypothetical protein
LTNNFTLPALTIAQIYKQRWQVELFFKWIKQHLRIKAFYGTSENAVKTQIWIAVSVYLLVAIVRKRLGLETSLYQILQILSLTLFEKTPHFMRSSGHRRGRQFHRKPQPTDSVRVLTGQQCLNTYSVAASSKSRVTFSLSGILRSSDTESFVTNGVPWPPYSCSTSQRTAPIAASRARPAKGFLWSRSSFAKRRADVSVRFVGA